MVNGYSIQLYTILGVHDMQQSLRKAEPDDYKHAGNDM